MKRKNIGPYFNATSRQEHDQQTAYHEAGHATAIYIRNDQLQLPPIYFQITFKPLTTSNKFNKVDTTTTGDDSAIIEGGCLIQNLPISVIENSHYFSEAEQQTYLKAVSADMVNLMVGPLAEAKYTALRDNEWSDLQFDNIEVLKHYGGSYDIEKINEYLCSHFLDKQQRSAAARKYINIATAFINIPENWYAIMNLAKFIEQRNSNVITYQQIISVINQSLEQWDNQYACTANKNIDI